MNRRCSRCESNISFDAGKYQVFKCGSFEFDDDLMTKLEIEQLDAAIAHNCKTILLLRKALEWAMISDPGTPVPDYVDEAMNRWNDE